MKLNRITQWTVEILELVSKNPDGVTLDEICNKLQLPKASGYNIVTALTEMGMVNVAQGQEQRYIAELTAYYIGINYTSNLDFIGVIESELRAFTREVRKTVFFGIRSDREVVYIRRAEPENPVITMATVGTKNPMYCTSLGKMIPTFNDEETEQRVMNRIKYRKKTERAILSRETLEQELEKVQAKGYVLDARGTEDHMECADAPIFGPDGSVLGAISVSNLYKLTEDYEVLGMLVREKAAQVSKILDYLPPKTLTNSTG